MRDESVDISELRQLYNDGCPLRSAWFHFAPSDRWRQVGLLKALPVSVPEGWAASAEQFGAAEKDLKEWLLFELSVGRLWALGATEMEDAIDIDEGTPYRLERVSPYLADPRNVRWGEDRISDVRIEYRYVRVIGGVRPIEQKTTQPQLLHSGRKRGRKGMKVYASEILDELFEGDPSLKNHSVAQLISIFNSKLVEKFRPSDPGIHIVTPRSLNNYLSEYWKKLEK